MNTQTFDNKELEFQEHCEFCDLLLEFQDVHVIRLDVDHHWTVCEHCYGTFITSVKPE